MSSYANSIHSRELVDVNGFPVKMYTFSIALDAFSGGVDEIRQYLSNMLQEHPEITAKPHLYAIAAPWGYKEHGGHVKAIDVLSYAFDRPWDECNPDVDAWIFKDGVHRPEDRGLTCETTAIILGKEGELRRKTEYLWDYLRLWPNIGELGPVV